MTPKEAVAIAKQYVEDLFAGDGAKNIGLEELRYDSAGDRWLVTIGFSRAWEALQGSSKWNAVHSGEPIHRTFKTVTISDADGHVLELKHWPVAA